MELTLDYNVDDEVLFMWENLVTKGVVRHVEVLINSSKTIISYHVGRRHHPTIKVEQSLLFKSKADLLASLQYLRREWFDSTNTLVECSRYAHTAKQVVSSHWWAARVLLLLLLTKHKQIMIMNGDIFSPELLLIGRLDKKELQIIRLSPTPFWLDQYIYSELEVEA